MYGEENNERKCSCMIRHRYSNIVQNFIDIFKSIEIMNFLVDDQLLPRNADVLLVQLQLIPIVLENVSSAE